MTTFTWSGIIAALSLGISLGSVGGAILGLNVGWFAHKEVIDRLEAKIRERCETEVG